jgi:hypothetical protein
MLYNLIKLQKNLNNHILESFTVKVVGRIFKIYLPSRFKTIKLVKITLLSGMEI